MKLKSRKAVLILLGVLLFGFLFAAWQFHYRWKWVVADYKRQLVAAEEKLTVAELLPPPVKPEDNSAETFLKAAALIEDHSTLFTMNAPNAMKMVAPGKAMISWQQPEIRGWEATNSWQDADALVAQSRELYEMLDQVVGRPTLDFHFDYQSVFVTNFPIADLSALKQAAIYLESAAICDMHRDDTTAATRHLRDILALVKETEKQPMVMVQLIRFADVAIAQAPTWELLQSQDVTDEQLATVQKDWEALEFIDATERSFEMERARDEVEVTQWRASNTKLEAELDLARKFEGGEEKAPSWIRYLWPDGASFARARCWRIYWSYPDELRAEKGRQALLETIRSIQTNRAFYAPLQKEKQDLAELGIVEPKGDASRMTGIFGEPDVRTFLSRFILGISRVTDRMMNAEITRNVTITAIALKRYQLKYGRYPSNLADLTPEFLSAVPLDSVDGKPLRYHLKADGSFVLYSIGEDDFDNGGDPTPAVPNSRMYYWLRGRDFVWPSPATTAEIEKYYQEQASQRN